MEQEEKHLSAEQVECVAGDLLGETLRDLPAGGLAEAQRHLTSCEACRKLVAMHRDVHRRLLSLSASGTAGQLTGCPGYGQLWELACGTVMGREAEILLEHVAGCGSCGSELRRITMENSEEEQSVLKGLKSGTAEWQQALAGKLQESHASKPIHRDVPAPPPWWMRFGLAWGFGGICLAAVVAGVLWYAVNRSKGEVDLLLARAYSERRTVEVRMADGDYSPLQVRRGDSGSRLDRSPSLLEADALIARGLAKHSSDVSWLHAKARADLLEWNYESAIETLREVQRLAPNFANIDSDLATAFFERAEAADRAVDYGRAAELLGAVLRKNPSDKVAIFNRAVVYEKMALFHEAQKDWKHYLELDPRGGWAEEAKRRLAALEQKLSESERHLREPLLGAADFAAQVSGTEQESWDLVDDRIEEYADVAVRHWLPDAFQNSSDSARSALTTLSVILKARHGDSWLSDVLNDRATAYLADGFAALSNAVERNRQGNPVGAEPEAARAAKLFRSAESFAGLARAEFEQLYVLHRTFRSSECLTKAALLRNKIRSREYPWIAAQLNLEEFSCRSFAADLSRGEESVQDALNAARKARYPSLTLRATGYEAGIETDKGNIPAAWQRNLEGLRLYWSEPVDPLRAYQFYDDLDSSAETFGQWYLARALAREAVTAIAQTPNKSGEGMARYQLAKLALQLEDWEESSREFGAARDIFRALPEDRATRTFEADAEIGLANTQLKRGQIGAALERLNHLKSAVSSLPAYTTRLDFFRTAAEVQWQLGNRAEAQGLCRMAASIAEQGLLSLGSEQDRVTWNRESSDCYRLLVRAELAKGDSIGALELWEWYQGAPVRAAPGMGRAHESSGRPGFDVGIDGSLPHELQGRLTRLRNETAIVFAELGGEVVIWMYDDRGVFATRAPASSTRVSEEADRLSALCADAKSDLESLRQSAGILYGLLIEPLADRLDSTRVLMFETDGALGKIPFEALVDPAGRYMGERFAVVSSLGMEYAVRARASRPIQSEMSALVVGDPRLVESTRAGLVPLVDAVTEAAEVSRRFKDATLLLRSDATAGRVLRELPHAQVFHFAGHAVSSAEASGLALSGEERKAGRGRFVILGSAGLQPLSLKRCELVVLSACKTGTAPAEDEGSDESLVRVFLLAGVPHVVASRWAVDSQASREFVDLFYRSLLSGSSVSGAMQFAASSLRKDRQSAHPYYWAGFNAFGAS